MKHCYLPNRLFLLQDTFSASLPIMEETAFEEKFKYLIVTSSLMNDTLSVHPKQKQRQSSTSPHPFHATTAHTRSARIGTVVTISGLLVALGVERLLLSQENVYTLYQQEGITGLILNGVTSTLTTALAGGVSLYFVYRHLVRMNEPLDKSPYSLFFFLCTATILYKKDVPMCPDSTTRYLTAIPNFWQQSPSSTFDHPRDRTGLSRLSTFHTSITYLSHRTNK